MAVIAADIVNDTQKFKPNLMNKGNAIKKIKLGMTAIRTFQEREATFWELFVSRYSQTIANKVVNGKDA